MYIKYVWNMGQDCVKIFIITQDRRRLRKNRWTARVYGPCMRSRKSVFTGYSADEVVLKVLGEWHENQVEGVARNLLTDVLEEWDNTIGAFRRGRYYSSQKWLNREGRWGKRKESQEDDGDGREQEDLS